MADKPHELAARFICLRPTRHRELTSWTATFMRSFFRFSRNIILISFSVSRTFKLNSVLLTRSDQSFVFLALPEIWVIFRSIEHICSIAVVLLHLCIGLI